MPKGRLPNQALEALRRFDQGNTVQPGVFSTLDEIIMEAPFDTNSADQWEKYLQPGRVLKREGAQFPLKKEELEYSGTLDILRGARENPEAHVELVGPREGGKLSKNQLRELVSKHRQDFSVSMAHETLEQTSRNPIPAWWAADGRQFGAEVKVDAPKYGTAYAGDTDSRLFHASPGSDYEESVTRMPGLNYRNHFSDDTLSWSRTSTHKLPQKSFEQGFHPRRVRLIEEIQSDLHSDAANKKLYNSRDNQWYDNEDNVMLDLELQKGEEIPDFVKPTRVGHMDRDAKVQLEAWEDEMETLQIKARQSWHNPDSPSKELMALQNRIEQLLENVEAYKSKVPDAPYKNPRDYAGLELRKQLLNAVDNDEDYLALVRGKDQIARYSQGMDERAIAGMEKMYDEVYPSELKKLAKRYGANIVDVEVPTSSAIDFRPEAMTRNDYESFNDFIADHQTSVFDLNNPYSYSSDINMVDSTLDELKDFGEQVMPILHSHTGFAEHDVNILKKHLSDIGHYADEFNELKLKPTEFADPGWESALKIHLQWQKAYQARVREPFDAVKKMLDDAYKDYVENFEEISGGGAMVKDFPAIELTPEVKDRIKKLGVPQFARGGVVKMQQGGLSVFSGLRRPDAPINEDEYEQVYANLSETDDERRLQEKIGTGKYWWDTVKHLPAMFLARMKKVNPETGEVRWLGQAPVPDLDMVARGLMTMEEWKEDRAAAEKYNEAGKDFHSTWVDDTKAMAALPAMVGNLAGEYLGIGPGSISDPEAGFQYPEFAVEAGERVGQAERAAQEDFGLEDPTGFPQHLMGALGAMGTQIPVPGGQIRGAVKGATSKIPQALKTAAMPITKPLGAASEFINPLIDPSAANYATGATFGGVLGNALEPSGEDVRGIEDMQRKQEKFEDTSTMVADLVTNEWGMMEAEDKMLLMYSPFAETVWETLDEDQKRSMMEELEATGAFDEEEEPTEFAKGGYIKDLVKLRGNVVDAEKLFESKRLRDRSGLDFEKFDESIDKDYVTAMLGKREARERNAARKAGELESMSDDAFKDPYDPANIEVLSREHLPPTIEFQKWMDDFQVKLDKKTADKQAAMSKLEFRYKPGDKVMGQKHPHEILFKTIDSRDGLPAYHVKNLNDESEYILPERGIVGKFGKPKGVE